MQNFLSYIIECVKIFKNNLSNEPVRIVGHLDCDGITASSILIKAFYRENIKFVYSSNRQLNEKTIIELKKEHYKIIFFADFGSNLLDIINEELNEKKIFILDHHKFQDIKKSVKTEIYNINPNKFGIDDNFICGSGIAYLFSKCLNKKNKSLAYIALIGAIGDMQDINGFSELNKYILNDSIESNDIEIKIGLSMFGLQTKPLYKLLQFSTEIFIPGVTGDENGAKMFLNNLGIDLIDKNGNYRKIFDLNKEETNKLITAIIISRIGIENNPENILGNIYLLKREEDGVPTRDAREFSTLINACGRLNMPSLGVGACLNDKRSKEKAFELLRDYKNEIINSLNWVDKNRKTENIIEREKLIIINSKNNIRDTVIGTVNSILTKSGLFENGTIIVSMAYSIDNNIKISLRSVNNSNIDLGSIIKDVCECLNGAGGGHPNAAGGLIQLDKEKEFIEKIVLKLNKLEIEEK